MSTARVERETLAPPRFSPAERASLLFVLCIFTGTVYRIALSAPFVQDDWFMLQWLHRTAPLEVLANAFSPLDKLLYRPLAVTYFLVIYKLFGTNVPAFHVVALALHVGNSLLIAAILVRLTGRRFLSVITAMLYAAAASVHLEPILWLVGFYDLGAIFFSLSCILMFLDRHTKLSAAALALALFTKESAVAVPCILLVYALMFDPPRLRSLLPHGVIFTCYCILKLLGGSPFAASADNPYATQLAGAHVIANALLYGRWILETVVPPDSLPFRYAAAMLILVCLFAVATALRHRRTFAAGTLEMAGFLGAWAALGLMPVLPLLHQAYRYYLGLSLGPLFCLLLLLLEQAIPWRSPRYTRVLAMSFVLIFMGLQLHAVNSARARGASEVSLPDGTNHLIRKGFIVKTVSSQLLARYPHLPRRSILVLPAVNVQPFGGSIGPRFWYNDTTIDVLSTWQYDSTLAEPRLLDIRPTFVVSIDIH